MILHWHLCDILMFHVKEFTHFIFIHITVISILQDFIVIQQLFDGICFVIIIVVPFSVI